MSRLSLALSRELSKATPIEESRYVAEDLSKDMEGKLKKAIAFYKKDPSFIEVVKDGFMDYWAAVGAKKVGADTKKDLAIDDVQQFLDIVTAELKRIL